MRPSGFSGNGLYNLKFMSQDGRNEGVYVSTYGAKNESSNKGKACTEKTDPKNMGTYNFSGTYYKESILSESALNHWRLDISPYKIYGNVSEIDLPEKNEEKPGRNLDRYDSNLDAQEARKSFEEMWKGLKQ